MYGNDIHSYGVFRIVERHVRVKKEQPVGVGA
jgi:hypothetical protein